MAKKPATATLALSASAINLLATIVAASAGGNISYIAKSDDATALVDGKFIEVNPEMIDEAGNAAARPTEQGIKFMNAQNTNPATASAPAAASAKPTFEIFTKAPTAAKRNTGGAATLYPFDDLPAPTTDEAGKPVVAAFFVPATADRPEPWKTLASTVSSASKRYATKTGDETYVDGNGAQKTRGVYEYSRKFRLSEGERNGVKGAIVERVV